MPTLIILLAMTLLISSHPLLILISLVIFTISISLKMLFCLKSSFMPMMFILAMLGGLIILFMYMASLAPNEIFPNLNYLNFLPFFMLTLYVSMLYSPSMNNNNMMEVAWILNTPAIMIFLTMYLLGTLLIIVFLISYKMGPLRAMYDKT